MIESNCLFCQILRKDIPAEIVFENDKVVAFKDINPIAKVHLLFIHRNHSQNINEMTNNPQDILDIYSAIKKFSLEKEYSESGFRVITNLGKNACQTVFHTHFHFLAGEKLSWS
ncbi:HIT domain-containing protein [Bacteriovoracaceae bacterium]|nr:HIT domain-containing protein [Bacteriovoracaceae bacterium]